MIDTKLLPDLNAELVPRVGAAGFLLGEDLSGILQKIGPVDWFESGRHLDCVLAKSSGWIGVRQKAGAAAGVGRIVESLIYRDDLVSLDFSGAGKLYRIVVGKGYSGAFKTIVPGDALTALSDWCEIKFNDMDDDFFVEVAGRCIDGIGFITDHRASLENAPNQRIEYISVHDWSAQ